MVPYFVRYLVLFRAATNYYFDNQLIYIYIYQTLFSKATYALVIKGIIFIFFVSMCVPWELNPQTFALLTQCSTTEPKEHIFFFFNMCFPSD